MHIYGFHANYKKSIQNNKHKGYFLYIDWMPRASRNVSKIIIVHILKAWTCYLIPDLRSMMEIELWYMK